MLAIFAALTCLVVGFIGGYAWAYEEQRYDQDIASY